MDIVVHAMGMPFGPRTVYEASLGGSETAAFYLAHGLAQRGHRVTLFTTREAPTEVADGVSYVWCGAASAEEPLGHQFEHYARHTPHDVLIIQRHPLAFTKKFNAKVCIWQLHDLALKRSQPAALAGLWQIDAVTCVSDWHCAQVRNVWQIADKVLFTVPNGVDPALYESTGARPFVRADGTRQVGRHEDGINLPTNKHVLLYQSRPERGLEHLVRPGGIMDRVRDLPVHLVFCGYENTTAEMAPYYRNLWSWAAALPNCTFVGALSKPQLAELQRKSDLLIYPTEFKEVSCITAMEAMHAGLPMLTSDCAALSETCAGSGTVLLPLKDGKADEDAFVAWLKEHVGDERGYPEHLHYLKTQQHKIAQWRTWEAATSRLEAVIQECFDRRYGTPASILRTALERSDIDFARWYYEAEVSAHEAALGSPILQAAINELNQSYRFVDSDAAMSAHYARHTAEYYDENEDKVIGEDVTRSLRFMGVAQCVEQEHNLAGAPLRVLDYGCAHGHYLVPLAKSFPNSEFEGVDLSVRAVSAANKWLRAEGIANAQVSVGGEDFLETAQALGDGYHLIIAGEVLEHARDWRRLLALLRGALAPGGVLIITTPAGPWERADFEKWRGWREHLVHFEKEDIREICAEHQVEITYAPASHDRVGDGLGSWIWQVRPTDGVEFGDINYERKLRTYAPRETISACLIVKDSAKTLRKCVESFVDWVDEIRIYIDPTTKDNTREIAASLKADFLYRAIHWQTAEKSALRDGFDEARNESISDAHGDWILWCDADEEIQEPWTLQRLARPSMHDGYGFAQLHYAVDPPQVLTTDYPCRFFRNRRGVRFYGVVHEHPEDSLGDAIKTSIVRPELKFLHCGYIDEETRRKRFQRNFPLVQRDLKKHPTRKLIKFLWLRDLAQSILFEQQQMGGLAAEEHQARAREGIAAFEELIVGAPPRMIVDALPYYTHCVSTVGEGFEATLDFRTRSPTAPQLKTEQTIAGRFHSREFFQRLVAHLLEEATKTYEDEYL